MIQWNLFNIIIHNKKKEMKTYFIMYFILVTKNGKIFLFNFALNNDYYNIVMLCYIVAIINIYIIFIISS